MAVRDVTYKPSVDEEISSTAAKGSARKDGRSRPDRYRRLPTGTHGLDPEVVKRDQRERLQSAIIELIAQKGYTAVRIVDLAKLAHVSQPTFYSLYADKEELFLSAYEEIAERAAAAVIGAYSEASGSQRERLIVAMRSFGELAASEPEPMSLLVIGALGAGAKALERRRLQLDALEQSIIESRGGASLEDDGDFTVKVLIGGVREVTAARLREDRASELPGLAQDIAAWALAYPLQLPPGLAVPAPRRDASGARTWAVASERARRAEGRLPSGRSDLPRQFIVKSQRERIVDATAAIVAEKGLAALTVPEIARRANISNQTFYSIYKSKHEAFLGAQKVGMHQGLQIAGEAYDTHAGDWPRAVAEGLRALVEFMASEPAHAHLSLVDTFASCPEALEIRNTILQAFVAYLQPGYELARKPQHVSAIAAEAVAGGIWQVLHHYIENECVAELPEVVPQLTYMALTPFLGPTEAARVALATS